MHGFGLLQTGILFINISGYYIIDLFNIHFGLKMCCELKIGFLWFYGHLQLGDYLAGTCPRRNGPGHYTEAIFKWHSESVQWQLCKEKGTMRGALSFCLFVQCWS